TRDRGPSYHQRLWDARLHFSWWDSMKFVRLAAAIVLLAAALGQVGALAVAADLAPDRLKCEMTIDPLGVDVAQPRLSWIVTSSERSQKQTAYQVLVASAPDRLKDGSSDLWDSGKVESRETFGIAYVGKALASSQQAWWTVRVWDRDGEPSSWSQ